MFFIEYILHIAQPNNFASTRHFHNISKHTTLVTRSQPYWAWLLAEAPAVAFHVILRLHSLLSTEPLRRRERQFSSTGSAASCDTGAATDSDATHVSNLMHKLLIVCYRDKSRMNFYSRIRTSVTILWSGSRVSSFAFQFARFCTSFRRNCFATSLFYPFHPATIII